MPNVRLLGHWRRTFQTITVLLVALTPFIKLNGNSLARIDIPSLTFFLAGKAFRIEELYIFWLLTLGTIFLFILVTMALGRVWCGWLCPQTTISDLADFLIKKTGLNKGQKGVWKRPLLHSLYLLTSAICGLVFVWYFVEPSEFMTSLAEGRLGKWPTGTCLVISTIIYLDLVFVRRLFCKAFCPYGRFQTVLADKGTLTLQAHPNHISRCIDCKACVRSCPTGIDIREGFQIECINCGQCLDACRKVMAKKGQPGIIQYTFGIEDLGWQALLTPKIAAIFLIVLVLWGSFIYTASHRMQASLKIGRSTEIASRLLADGHQATFFRGFLLNHEKHRVNFTITVQTDNGERLQIKGPSTFNLQPEEKRPLNLAVVSRNLTTKQPQPILFLLHDEEGTLLLKTSAYIAPL